MLNRVIYLFAFLAISTTANASPPKDGALQFEVPVLQGTEKYLDLLAYPSYLVVALENNGLKASNMGRPRLLDERTVQFKSATLHFEEKKGSVYFYKGSLEWDIPLKHIKFDVPVEIDTSSISKGHIQFSVFLPLANFFPDALVERIKLKIQFLSGPAVQRQLLAYFDDLSKKTGSQLGIQGLFTNIMLQSYGIPDGGLAGCESREPGDAESLADQAYLLTTLAIWLFIVPGGIAITVYLHKKKRIRRN
jgi:hypothetical protein